MHLIEKIAQIQKRIPLVRGKGEEATKQALVLPFIEALGYDVWDPNEVCPEFHADFAVKKGGQREKVDLAILVDRKPRIFIEVKSIDTSLDKHEGQLRRYFNGISTVTLGILTNGSEYRFYTDSLELNMLDEQPFLIVRLTDLDLETDVLHKFTRDLFNPTSMRDHAVDARYAVRITDVLRSEIDVRHREPSDALVRWILDVGDIYDGRATSVVIERFRSIVKDSLRAVIRDIVTDGPNLRSPVLTPPLPKSEPPVSMEGQFNIVTTKQELTAFCVVADILEESNLKHATIYDAAQQQEVPLLLEYEDRLGYFGIYFNKPAWWFTRIAIENQTPWIWFNVDPTLAARLVPPNFTVLPSTTGAIFRVQIAGVDDIRSLKDVVIAAMQKTIDDRKHT